MSKEAPRQVSKIIRLIRDRLMKRTTIEQLRYENTPSFASRDTTGVNLPGGVSTKMSANDYFTRDARRLVEPPQVVFSFQSKLLGSGTEPASGPAKVHHIRPGKVVDYGRYIEYDETLNNHELYNKRSGAKPATA